MKKIYFLFFLLFASTLFADSVVNLSAPPEERWEQAVDQFNKEVLQKYAALIDQSISKAGVGERWLRKELMNYGWNRSIGVDTKWFLDLRAEVRGLAKTLKTKMDGKELPGFKEEDLFLLNIGYDFSTYCTTGVYQTDRGPILFRNLDWEGDDFRTFTFETTFQKDGKTLFRSIQFLGQVGVLTGLKPQGYAVALNYRKTPGATFSEWNIIQGLFTDGWSCSFLLRYTLERDNDFNSAKARLEQTKLMAPCYLTIAGIANDEGVVFERGRESAHSRSFSDINENPQFIVQTNHDIPLNPGQNEIWAGDDMLLNEGLGMGTIARRDAAIAFLNTCDKANPHDQLLEMLATYPQVYNPLTIFSSLLIPYEDQIYLIVH